jgi:hypothetical protein
MLPLYQVPGTSADASSKKDKALSSPTKIVEREDTQDGDGKLRRWNRIRKCVFLKVQNKTASV